MSGHQRRRRALVLILLLLAISVPHLTSAAQRGDGRPDIVVVMVDDLGAIDERVLERLPNIRELWLEGGLRFDAAYSETPLCCPGRASFLTGQHTRKHGVVRNRAVLLDPSQTIATALHDAGYWTIMAGKYLNHADRLVDKTPDGWDRVAMLRTWLGNMRSNWWLQGRQHQAGYNDRFLLNRSLRWLERAPTDKPVFMYLLPRAPHFLNSTASGRVAGYLSPWRADVEPRYMDDSRCDDIEPWRPPNYRYAKQPNGFPLGDICRSLLTVDEMVGSLRAEMTRQGRNPLWMFTSDNGMAWGANGFPLKNVPEAGRLPLYFAGRGVSGGSTDALVSNIDFGPTLASVAGTSMPAADGVTFRRLLRGGRGGRSWMLEDHPVGGRTGRGHSGSWWAVRTPQWHLIDFWGEQRLHDLRADPWEQVNVAGTNPETVQRLRFLRNTIVDTKEP